MCGRYAAGSDQAEVIEEFDVALVRTDEAGRTVLKNPQEPPPGAPDWNMAPGKQARVVLTRAVEQAPVRQLRLLTWGLVPSWAKDPAMGLRMINAKAETVADKPAFAKALASRRCLVPADGWFEWQASPTVVQATGAGKGKPRKQPFFVHRLDGRLCAFAGLYDFWRDPAAPHGDPAAWLSSFTIITTAAESGLDRIHDRQPLVLEPSDWARWLDPDLTRAEDVADLLAADSPGAAPGRFDAYPVGREVGSSRANGPQLLDPAPRGELDGVLDPVTGELIGAGPDTSGSPDAPPRRATER